VKEETVLIPRDDGRWLQARLWRPEGTGRWPAIIESSPYRAGDLFAPLVEGQIGWFAEHGYVVLAIDIAGSGNSPGLLHDEYEPQEIDDLVAAIDWASRQDWCDGGVGLCGFSWAAFAALRAAEKKPPALKAMVLGGVSEDGWQTDIHYMNGAPYVAQVDWAGVMLMLNALPPDPAQFRGDWRAEWHSRLRNDKPWLLHWLTNPERNTYWLAKAAPLESAVPLLLYAGLADKYAASVLRIAQGWRGPVRTILGPWEHSPPDIAGRGPRIGMRQEALRWWDAYLKGGVPPDGPPVAIWIGAPDEEGGMTNGEWRALRSVIETAPLSHHLTWRFQDTMPPTLAPDLYEDAPAPFDYDRFRGRGGFGIESRYANTVDFAGAPKLKLRLGGPMPGQHVTARLLDIGDKAVRIVTAGARVNGTEVDIDLPPVGWRLAKGHTLALTLEAQAWPTFWNPPTHAALEVSSVELGMPLLSAGAEPLSFEPPLPRRDTGTEALKWLTPEPFAPSDDPMTRDTTSAAHHLTATGADYHIASRFEVAPDGDRAAKSYRVAFERPGWHIRIETRLEVSSTPEAFDMRWHIEARDGDTVVHRADESATIPRTSI